MSNNLNFKDVKKYLKLNAIVLDVRTNEEYDAGHLEGSLHIVLDTLEENIDQLKAYQKPIITCCRSGVRSEKAKDVLKENGIDAINGGPWQNVEYFSK